MVSPNEHYIMQIIERFLQESQVEYSASSGFFNKLTNDELNEKSVLNKFLIYSITHTNFVPHGRNERIKISREDFKIGFSEWKESKKKEEIGKLRNALAYCPDDLAKGREALNNWLKSVLWRAPSEEETAVMLHFLHQVKRKLFGHKAKYHMMPVLVAGQGSGKTESIKWLTKPFGIFFKDTNLEALEDSRNDLQYSSTFVMMLDELSKADKADIRALKQRITSDEISARLFHTQDFMNVKMNTTFIGASNESIDMLIQDSTGMRRYFQLIGPTKDEVQKLSIKQRQAIWDQKQPISNVFLIWKSVDEKLSLLPEMQEQMENITKTQESIKAIDPVEEFLLWSCYQKADSQKSDYAIKTRSLYTEFKDFCEENGEKYVIAINRFSAKLKHLGYEYAIKSMGGKTERVFYIQKSTAKNGLDLLKPNMTEEELRESIIARNSK